MTIQRLGVSPRMSQAVVHRGIAYLAGQVGEPGATPAGQTESILAKIDALLGEVGSDKSKILSATIWLADMGDFQQMNAAWDAWVDRANPPARATVEAKLAHPDYTVEIAVVAAVE